MSKQLEASEHYKAYVALGCLPFGVAKFEDSNDEVNIHLGEIYCRVEMPGVVGELCGVKFKSRGALVNHIKKYHNHVTVKAAEATGNPSMQKITDARVFFSTIMNKHHENAAAKRSERVHKTTTPPPTPKRRRINQSVRKGKGKQRIEPVDPPVYKSSNKKRKQIKGEVNLAECARIVKRKGGAIPCNSCRQNAADNKDPVPRDCDFSIDCESSVFFNFVFETEEEVELQGGKDDETAEPVVED